MQGRPNVWAFVAIAYGFTWLFWGSDALIAQGIWDAPERIRSILAGPWNLGPYGPLVAAIVVTLFAQGPRGVGTLLRRGLKVRIGAWWWVALLVFPVLVGASLAIGIALGDPVPTFEALAQPIALPVSLVWIFFLGGPLQEEFGWRGLAFEQLSQRIAAGWAALAAGLMWGLWHLPLFFVPRADMYYNKPIWGLIVTTLLVGIILAWIYVGAGKSIFAVLLAHAMFNWSNFWIPALESDIASLVLFGAYGLMVAYILVRFGWRTWDRAQPPAGRGAPASSG